MAEVSNDNSFADDEGQQIKRKLASVVRMGPVIKHPNADRLSIGEIGGWKVVIGNETKEGDIGIYFEIDSVLPEGSDWYKHIGLKGPIIKTRRIREQLSQGLFIPLVPGLEWLLQTYTEEQLLEMGDVTEILQVIKRTDTIDDIEPTGKGFIPYSQVFTSGPSKSDEPRLQSNKYLLKEIQDIPYYITVKYDGSSQTIGYDRDKDVLRICSRSVYVPPDSTATNHSPYLFVAEKYNMLEKLRKFPDLVLQGELYGVKIQKNLLNVPQEEKYRFAVFTIWNTWEMRRLSYDEMLQTCKELEIPMVQVVEEGDSFPYTTVSQLLEKAKGFYPGTKNVREGIVVRPKVACKTSKNEKLSFKVINNDYLLKHEQ